MAKKPKYRVDTHYFPGSTDSERQSFEEGVKSVKERPYLHAYYAGVGYSKGLQKKAVGFKNDEEKARFDAGMEQADRHYMVVERVHKDRRLFRLRRFLRKIFRKAKKESVSSSSKPRERSVTYKGRKMTVKRPTQSKRYRVAGGTHVNKKKSVKRKQ